MHVARKLRNGVALIEDRATDLPAPLRIAIGVLLRLLKLLLGSIVGAAGVDGRIALTFDDGPDPNHTPRILEVLRSHGARATFFVLAEHVDRDPDLARRVRDEGHEIALHGKNHDRLTTLSLGQIVDRVVGGKRRLRTSLGVAARLFRPPYGSQDLRSYLVARLGGMRVVVWSADPHDWEDLSVSEVVTRAVDRSRPGGILLMHDGVFLSPDHDGSPPSYDRAELVDRVLRGLEEKGIEPVTVSELLASGSPRRTLWYEA